MSLYDVMAKQLEQDRTAFVVTVLSGPRSGDKVVYSGDGDVLYGDSIDGFTVDKSKANQVLNIGSMECFVQPVEKDPEVLVLGAGHVSRCIADLLLFVGCHVTVVDDRAEYLRPDFFDERVKSICIDFGTLQENLPLTNYSGIIIVTRAHEYDSLCLNQLRHLLPMYMGVMGSHKRIFHAFEALKNDGWTQNELDQIYGPIGLNIGAETPEEIAMSIVSEYLAVTRSKAGGFLSQRRDGNET